MFKRENQHATLSVIGLGAALILGQPARGQTTPMQDLVMYGIDADTFELMRYQFSDDTFTRLGRVRDQDGQFVNHPESFAYVPGGPNQGFFTTTTRFGPIAKRDRLVKVDGITVTGYMYPAPHFTRTGVRGMVPDLNPATGVWSLLALAHNSNSPPMLTRINLTTGRDSDVCVMRNPNTFA